MATQEQRLNQNAIDALFAHVKTVEVIEVVNFADRKSITPAQMLMLVSLNQGFSRSLSIKLSAWLGATIKISMVAAERGLYSSLLEDISVESTYFGQARFHTPDCRALISMDLVLTEPVVNLGLGGPHYLDEDNEPRREITLIDIAIINVLLSTICVEINQIWGSYKLHMEYESEVLPANAARVFPSTENVLSFTYEVAIGSVQGTFQIAFATAVSDVILRELDSQDSRRFQSPAVREIIEQRVGDICQLTTLRLPPFMVRASDVVDLKPGSVLKSSLARSSPFRFEIPGGPAWDATAVVVDNRISARIDRALPIDTAAAAQLAAAGAAG